MTVSHSKLTKFVIAPLAVVIFTACSQAPAQIATAGSKVERPVQVMILESTQQSNIKQFSGVLEATQTANLAFRVPGTIQDIFVKTGDNVEKDQILARLDPHDYQVNVVELQARLAEANAAHHLAKVELERVQQAIADDAISKVNLDRAQSGYQRSLAMVDVMTQNLQKSQDALDYTELKAPFSGVIGSKSQQTFEQTSPGISLFSLHQPNELKAMIDVPENLMNQLTLDQLASVHWHGAKTSLTARLSAMDTLADPIKQTYTVEFVIEQVTNALPGKAVNVAVSFNNNGASYCVPYAALIGEGADKSVYVVKEGTVIEKAVTLESLRSNSVCLSGELHTGDAIVTAGVHYLKPNQTVTNTLVKAFSY
ncbi:efflux RND transporter periplasmic adaptor subunit [Shewanella eurypsychrophilus]|uniref:Efflux RND transporter periplasmic adaptor subunit n=1 Tax=Shewanella eurypsychrophilus TaxID=2593656 RepID=A0ABX6V9H2_9GAMM|nr:MULTISPECIES: efflux RND transporter periplasmic adaptor subunit [Shewanella]QFU23284.1 efflux RND transporter periplasmic adaptor subunit [Shewanella sp. YLB-09]QPG58513.1 efflux RND transporter periplasmic adaptor subunit [Shewanella eurypsychrophilus]